MEVTEAGQIIGPTTLNTEQLMRRGKVFREWKFRGMGCFPASTHACAISRDFLIRFRDCHVIATRRPAKLPALVADVLVRTCRCPLSGLAPV